MPLWHGRIHKAVEIPVQPTWVGGGGRSYRTINPPGFVAKRPDDQESVMKARLLMLWKPKPAHVALPEDELSETPGGPPVAFLLPFVSGVVLFVLCYAAARIQAGITVTLWHLRRAAKNLAVAVADVHAAGLVVGDLNLMNVIVAPDDPGDPCRLDILDCDSFQFAATDPSTGRYHSFRTGVGVPEFLAPELQGMNLRDVDRTKETDRFALAVLVWMLLFDGAHPFAVRSISGGPVPAVEDCIRDGKSAITPGWPRDPDLQPVVTPAEFDALPLPLRHLFVEAFVAGHNDASRRPTAAAFAAALAAWEQAVPQLPSTAGLPAAPPRAASPQAPTSRPPAAGPWVAGIVGVAACLLLALFVASAGPGRSEKKLHTPSDTRKSAPPAGRFDDAPVLWREAAGEEK